MPSLAPICRNRYPYFRFVVSSLYSYYTTTRQPENDRCMADYSCRGDIAILLWKDDDGGASIALTSPLAPLPMGEGVADSWHSMYGRVPLEGYV